MTIRDIREPLSHNTVVFTILRKESVEINNTRKEIIAVNGNGAHYD